MPFPVNVCCPFSSIGLIKKHVYECQVATTDVD
jgi:hypothetical protein